MVMPSVDEYPTNHEFLFCATDDAASEVTEAIAYCGPLEGNNLIEALESMSHAVRSLSDPDADTMMTDFDDMESDVDFELDEGEYAQRKFPTAEESFSRPETSNLLDIKSQLRLTMDLKCAKQAGFKVSYYEGVLHQTRTYVCISIRIAKLGISEEAMQAWNVKPDQYLVLILCYPYGYKQTEEIMSNKNDLIFRVGICGTYKPKYQDIIELFQPVQKYSHNAVKNDESGTIDRNTFLKSFISSPLDELFNERFILILKTRYAGMFWNGAEQFYHDKQGRHVNSDALEDRYMEPEHVNLAYPDVVRSDHVLDENGRSEGHSLPLIAMQFLLRHFVRCTEFCLVCHCPVDLKLEAIKPFVCERPLCLYQYMSLGFGPEIEHEIRSQPLVVDLLISLTWLSAKCGKLATFPSGLSLSVPDPAFHPAIVEASPRQYYAPQTPTQENKDALWKTPEAGPIVSFDADKAELIYPKGMNPDVRCGDWVLIKPQYDEKVESMSHYRVNDVLNTVVRLSQVVRTQPAESTTLAEAPIHKESETKLQSAHVFKYDVNFDNIPPSYQRAVIMDQLNLLPPVSTMKEWLEKHPTSNLSAWKDMISPAALGILRWIVASNRACILQVDDSCRIEGMDGFLQFRFAMGAPDKEQRFIDAVNQTQERLKSTYPTLFAWHGSQIGNWHSIVREGLHYNYVACGRAYGDGVYNSLDYTTSLGYSGNIGYYTGSSMPQAIKWQSSDIGVTSVMALSEIVNAPKEFVSRTPHLVINKIDWIQTRYLFVKGTKGDTAPTPKRTSNIKVFPQDPTVTPRGATGAHLVIPAKAIPRARRPAELQPEATSAKHKGTISSVVSKLKQKEVIDLTLDNDDDTDSVATLDEDLDIFAIVEANTNNTNGTSKVSDTPAVESTTNFVPGTLDYETLPMLPPPTDSNTTTTKQLLALFKALKKTQDTTPQHELGWYTDPEQMNNVFQWIVELHSFPEHLPIVKQLRQMKKTSIVLEMRFPTSYPFAPPFIRVVRPRFLPFASGGGGHVTAGGSLCMELLTSDGWLATYDIASVLFQVRMAICSEEPRPAQLVHHSSDYGIGEAIEGYKRACMAHGWRVPPEFTNEMLLMDRNKENRATSSGH